MPSEEMQQRISLFVDGALDSADEERLTRELVTDPDATAYCDEVLRLRARLRVDDVPVPDVAGRVRAVLEAERAANVRTIRSPHASPTFSGARSEEATMSETQVLYEFEAEEQAPRRRGRPRLVALVAALAAAALVVGVFVAVRGDGDPATGRRVTVPPLSRADVEDLTAAFEQLGSVLFDGQSEITEAKLATLDDPARVRAYLEQLAYTYSSYYVAMDPVTDDVRASGVDEAVVAFHIRDTGTGEERWVSPIAPEDARSGDYTITAVRIDGVWKYKVDSLCDDVLAAFGVPCPIAVRDPEAAAAVNSPDGRAIQAVLDRLFDGSLPAEERLALIEGGDEFAGLAEETDTLLDSYAVTGKLAYLRPGDGERAEIGIAITSMTPSAMTPSGTASMALELGMLEGSAVRLDGEWQLGHRTACELFAIADPDLECAATPGASWEGEPAPTSELRGFAGTIPVPVEGADAEEAERVVRLLLDGRSDNLDAKRQLLGDALVIPGLATTATPATAGATITPARTATTAELDSLLTELAEVTAGAEVTVSGVTGYRDTGEEGYVSLAVAIEITKGGNSVATELYLYPVADGGYAADAFDVCRVVGVLGGTCPAPFESAVMATEGGAVVVSPPTSIVNDDQPEG